MKIDEAKKLSISCVYCLEFPNGKKYVGKTKNLCKRLSLYLRFNHVNDALYSAIKEFGWDSIDVIILRRLDCADSIDLDICLSILEVKYIRDLCTLYPLGYNISIGGECLGIPIECITTDSSVIERHNKGSKSVLLYDTDGLFVREYDSISRCAYDNGWDEDSVRSAIGKNKPFYGKYFLRLKRYDYVPNKIELPKGYEVRERVRYKNVVKEVVVKKEREVFTYTPALRYDMNGKFCGEYKSKSSALRLYTKNHCVDWGRYHNGYILFKKRDDNYPLEIEPYHILSKKVLGDYYVPASDLPDIEVNDDWSSVCTSSNLNKVFLCVNGKYTNIKHKFKVYQCNLNGELVAEFDSIRDASHETGIGYSLIYNCLRGATKKAAGYLWKSDNDNIKKSNVM